MSAFEGLGLAPTLLRAITELGFETPTAVQAAVIPRLLEGGRDLVALAQTGTGKTAAFGLPLLQLTDTAAATTQALVLCPTRELCLQIAKDLAGFSKYMSGLRVVAVYGGAGIEPQLRALRRGAQIIVATPGRLNDLLRRRAAKLAGVQRVVLDEADEMLNMGFQEELEAILKEVPAGARTLLFSATMPKSVAAIAGKYMQQPEEILVGQRNAGSEHITHECYIVHARDRYATLRRLLDYYRDIYAIVFCRTRVETEEVASHLLADGYNADALHGDLSQAQRDRVMQAFRDRKLQLLVATDVAARGLDVNNLTHVINYNLPDVATHYTHRSGRTGRAGRAGVSIAIVHLHETYRLGIIERLIKQPFEHKPVPTAREVCDSQLLGLLQRLKNFPVDERALAPYLPMINEVLGDLPREELLKRLVLQEFGRCLEYYRNAPDLNVRASHRPAGPAAPPREAPSAAGATPARDRASGEVVRLRINLGHRNGLTPAGLISLINRATPGPKLRIGRIRVMESDSVFEMYAHDARGLVAELNQAEVDGRAVHVVPVPNFAHAGKARSVPTPPRHPRSPHQPTPRHG